MGWIVQLHARLGHGAGCSGGDRANVHANQERGVGREREKKLRRRRAGSRSAAGRTLIRSYHFLSLFERAAEHLCMLQSQDRKATGTRETERCWPACEGDVARLGRPGRSTKALDGTLR